VTFANNDEVEEDMVGACSTHVGLLLSFNRLIFLSKNISIVILIEYQETVSEI
jgi:hypothetical protein